MRYSFFFGLILLLLVAGCQHAGQLSVDEADLPEPERTLVYVIHGDASYLYHSPDNEPLQADEETLRTAHHVAQNATDAEVLIFHQQPLSYRLGLFPQDDGAFYHYRAGQLVAEKSYKRDPAGSGLAPEAELYRAHRSAQASSRTLLYFGHELPDSADEQYHRSYPGESFGIAKFAEGIAQFEQSAERAKPFDLIILSTCSNGTPATLAHLAPLTNYVLASPEELHLTYFDSEPLHDVSADESPRQTAERLARFSFDRLEARTRTAVTVSLYDITALDSYLADLSASYDSISHVSTGDTNLVEYVDCQEAGLDAAVDLPGVDVWFRPAQFGSRSDRTDHSGWGCPVTPAWLSGQ